MEEQRKFYEIVEENLKTNVSTIKDLTEFEKIDDSKKYMLTGSIAYITGIGLLEFHKSPNVENNINQVMINAFNERLQRIGVELKDINNLFEVFKKSELFLKDDKLSEINQKNKETLNDNISINNDIILMLQQLKSCLENTITPIGFADDVKRLYIETQKDLKYRDLLLFNKFIFNDEVETTGNVMFEKYRRLQENKVYDELLEEARKRFEDQKYSVMNFELIQTLKEFFNHYGTEKTLEQILSEIYHYEDKNHKPVEQSNDIQTENETQNIHEIFEKQPLKSVYLSLKNTQSINTQEIKSVDDLSTNIEKYVDNLDNEDLESVIAYIRNMNVKRSEVPFTIDDFENIGDKSVEQFDVFKKFIESKFTEKSSEYKQEYEKYLAEIDPLHIEHLKPLIFNMLKDVKTLTSEQKVFVYNQMLENNISTYHHLNEFLSVVEQCRIPVTAINKYWELKDYILTNTEAKELFKNVDKVRKLNNESYFYQCLKNSF